MPAACRRRAPLLAVLGGLCALTSAAAPPVVIVTIDTLRSDRLPAYGYTPGKTPAIDRLARDGVVFEHAYSVVPLTLPSHASLFTALTPAEHGVRDNAGGRLAEGFTTLAERLRADGYDTAGAVSAWVLRASTGIAQGFDLWDDAIGSNADATLGERERPGRETLAAIRPWLEHSDRRDSSFLLFLHLFEPHDPYEPPEPFASLLPSPYDGEIAAADAIVGDLVATLERAGLYEQALIVVLSDHGEGLGDHGEDRHGVLLYREALQVPLLVKLPGGRHKGARIETPASLLDVAQLVLAEAGLATDGGMLAGALRGSSASRPILGETLYPRLRFGWSELRSVIEGGLHLIVGSRTELFDLGADPGELRDLAAARPEDVERLLRLVPVDDGPWSSVGAADEREPAGDAPSREEREALLALGYLTATVAERDRGGAPLPDPRDEVHVVSVLQRGITELRSGRLDRAIELLESALEEAPSALEALQLLGVAHERAGQGTKAIEAYLRAHELSGGEGPAAGRLAGLLSAAGRFDEAVTYAEVARLQDPAEPYYAYLRTNALLRLGRREDALRAARETVATFSGLPDALYQLAAVEISLDQRREAEGHLRAALLKAPDHTAALSDLAVLLTVEGRYAEARAVFERALALRPDDEALRQSFRRFEELAKGDDSR
jgi:arylsulfatase A-like enzyme/Flp pilus assembly protein TadD